MEQWKEIRLEDACTALSDGLHKAPKFSLNGDYIFVNAKNIQYGFIVDNDPMKKSTYEEYVKYASPLNDTTILYSIDGTIGNVALYRGEKCILGKGACYINPNPKIIDRQFLYYYLQSDVFQRYIDKMSTGSTIKHISLKTMRNFILTYPSISTQQRIVDILSSIDKKIALNRKINSNLEEQAKALFKSWFIDFEPFKGGKFVDSELGKIPEGWEVVTIGDVTENIKDKVGDRDNIKVLSPITSGQLVLSEDYFSKQVFSNSIAKYIVVKHNDFAYNPARINIGSIGMNEFDFDGCVSPVYVVFRCQKGYEYFFDLYRKTTFFTEEVKKRAIGGVRQTLSYKDLSLIQLVYPPKKVVENFNSIFISLLHTIHSNNVSNKKLEAIRDTLLPRLMSGEINVRL